MGREPIVIWLFVNLVIGFWCMRLEVSSSDGGVHLLWCLVTSGNLTFSELIIGPVCTILWWQIPVREVRE